MQNCQNARNQPPQETGEPRQCFKCNFEGLGSNITCPRCGKNHFLTAKNVRTRGTILVIVGLFLIALIGGISIFLAVLLFGSANQTPEGTRRVQEAMPMLLVVYGLFALLIAFGLNSLISGIWMLVTGRRNRVMLWVMWGLLALLGIAAIIVRFAIR